GVPDAALQHRRRRPALPRGNRCGGDRDLARAAPAAHPDDPDDVSVRRRRRCAVGADPRRAQGLRPDERDHHLADAQLRRGAVAHVPDLRQRLALAGRVHRPDAVVPAGNPDLGPHQPLTLTILMMCLCGGAAGALWALIPGALKAFGRTNEIITSLMLNYVAGQLLTYLIFDSASPWRDVSTVQTRSFPQAIPISGRTSRSP